MIVSRYFAVIRSFDFLTIWLVSFMDLSKLVLTTLTQIGLKKIRPFLVVFVPIDRYFVPIDRYFVPIDPMKALHSKAFRPSKKRKKEKKKKRKAIFHEKQPYALAKARTF